MNSYKALSQDIRLEAPTAPDGALADGIANTEAGAGCGWIAEAWTDPDHDQ